MTDCQDVSNSKFSNVKIYKIQLFLCSRRWITFLLIYGIFGLACRSSLYCRGINDAKGSVWMDGCYFIVGLGNMYVVWQMFLLISLYCSLLNVDGAMCLCVVVSKNPIDSFKFSHHISWRIRKDFIFLHMSVVVYPCLLKVMSREWYMKKFIG